MNIFDNFLSQLVTGDQIKDFKHASRLFVDNNYALSPKYDWLYHVYFDFDPQLASIMRDKIKTVESGMLVKNVDLPKFAIENRTFNNYNRPSLVQTKIRYQPISITFHDDQSNVVRNFWYDYFNYYYRDTDIGYAGAGVSDVNPTYYQKSKYVGGDRTQLNKFGYTPRSVGIDGNQFIRAIRIYSLHQKKFTEYTLLNPIISDFSHGSHGASQNGILENTMTIQYETVLYESGYVTPSTVHGFADLHYDKSPSPLSPAGGGTNSFLGPGGIVSAISGFAQNPAGGAFGLIRSYQKNKNVDLGGLASIELTSLAIGALSGQNPISRLFVPSTGAYSTNSPVVSGAPNVVNSSASSATSNGTAIAATGTAVAATNGVGTNSTAQGGGLNSVLNMDSSGVVSSVGTLFGFNYLANALSKYQAEKKAKVEAEQAKEAQKQASGYAAAAAASAKYEANNSAVIYSTDAPPGTTVYQSGTNNPVPGIQGSANSLAQTPNASSVVPASQNVSASNSATFVQNGNPIQLQPALSYAGNNLGSSTNPAPPNQATI
jgi:hypothetical protein